MQLQGGSLTEGERVGALAGAAIHVRRLADLPSFADGNGSTGRLLISYLRVSLHSVKANARHVYFRQLMFVVTKTTSYPLRCFGGA